MGKAADNETIKLTAAFWNNLSVGMSVGGVFVAYLVLFQRVLESPPALEAMKDGVFDSPDVRAHRHRAGDWPGGSISKTSPARNCKDPRLVLEACPGENESSRGTNEKLSV
jgi:hypothetical protein